jgi:hypothetical protein
MEMKSFVMGALIAVGASSAAYADLKVDNKGHVVSQNPVLSANTTVQTPLNASTQVVGTGAGGEANSATMDQNGRWQAPEASGQATTVTPNSSVPSSNNMSNNAPSVTPGTTVNTPSATVTTTAVPNGTMPNGATVTTPGGTTVTAPGNSTVTAPSGSTVTVPSDSSVTVQDKTN